MLYHYLKPIETSMKKNKSIGQITPVAKKMPFMYWTQLNNKSFI